MVWDVVDAYDGTVTASFATVTGSLFATDIFLNAVALIHGSLSYTGPACNCRIALTAAYGSQGLAGLQFSVYQDGVERIRIGTGGMPHPASGNYDFSLLAGTGSLIEIGASNAAFFGLTVIAEAIDALGPPSPGNGSVDFSFTASNI